MRGANRKVERNRAILDTWMAGQITQRELSEKFGISMTRVRQILENEIRREKSDNVDAFADKSNGRRCRKVGQTKVMKFEDVMQWDRVVFLQCREMSCSVPMFFMGEHQPFLRYRGDGIHLDVEVRAEYYGKTWRCFDSCPLFEDEYPWEDINGRRGWLTWDAQPGE